MSVHTSCNNYQEWFICWCHMQDKWTFLVSPLLCFHTHFFHCGHRIESLSPSLCYAWYIEFQLHLTFQHLLQFCKNKLSPNLYMCNMVDYYILLAELCCIEYCNNYSYSKTYVFWVLVTFSCCGGYFHTTMAIATAMQRIAASPITT